MFKMQLIRNQIGSGVLLASAAAVALGGAGFVISKMFSDSDKVLKKDMRVVSYRQLIDITRKNLYAGRNCTAALVGQDISGALVPGGKADIHIPLNLGDKPIDLKSGYRAPSGTSVKSVKLQIDKVARVNVRVPGIANQTAAYATVFVEPDHPGVNLLAKDASGKLVNEPLFIKMFVYYGSDKKITSCFDPASDATFCTVSLNGAYKDDPSVSSDKRCNPDLQCFTAKSGIQPMGAPCPAGFSSVKVGTAFQICNSCNPAVAPVSSLLGLAAQAVDEMDYSLTDNDSANCSGYGNFGTTYQDAQEGIAEYGSQLSRVTPTQLGSVNTNCLGYNPRLLPEDDPNDPTYCSYPKNADVEQCKAPVGSTGSDQSGSSAGNDSGALANSGSNDNNGSNNNGNNGNVTNNDPDPDLDDPCLRFKSVRMQERCYNGYERYDSR